MHQGIEKKEWQPRQAPPAFLFLEYLKNVSPLTILHFAPIRDRKGRKKGKMASHPI